METWRLSVVLLIRPSKPSSSPVTRNVSLRCVRLDDYTKTVGADERGSLTQPRNDPPQSNNSKNESSKQFRVIGESGRCFKAIPWLVRAYHRVARHPTAPTRELASSYRSSARVASSFRPPRLFSHPPAIAPTRPVPLRGSPTEFLGQRRIDNGSSRLSSLFYTHHLTPGRRKKSEPRTKGAREEEFNG